MINKLKELFLKLEQLQKEKLILVVVVCLVVAYLDSAFLISMQSRGVSRARQRIVELKEEMQTLKRDLAMMQQAGSSKGPVKHVKPQRVILDQEVPSLLQDISRIAKKNAVRIMQIKPEKSKGKQDAPAQPGGISPLSIKLELLAGFHEFGSFIANLEGGEIYLAVDEISMFTDARNSIKRKVNLVLKTYVKD
ncbi:type 4a pilus biogenesis protein PilO [Candidatus Omnitrophota bacterium]